MPRKSKRSGKRNMRGNLTTSVATRSTSSWEPTSTIGRGATSRSQEETSSSTRTATKRRGETSSTTRTATKRKNTSTCAPRAKRHSTHAANSRRDSDSEDHYTEEPDHTPLTKADIPSIVNTVLSNISTEGNSSRDDSQDVFTSR